MLDVIHDMALLRLTKSLKESAVRQLGSQSKSLYLVLLASLWGVQTADANDSVVEEIVVHGELRDNTLMSTPSSVSVISLIDWRAGTVNHLEELLSRAPNVNFSSGASRGRFIQIRGIGERGQFAEPLNPSVGLLLDGVDMSGIGTAATLFRYQAGGDISGSTGYGLRC